MFGLVIEPSDQGIVDAAQMELDQDLAPELKFQPPDGLTLAVQAQRSGTQLMPRRRLEQATLQRIVQGLWGYVTSLAASPCSSLRKAAGRGSGFSRKLPGPSATRSSSGYSPTPACGSVEALGVRDEDLIEQGRARFLSVRGKAARDRPVPLPPVLYRRPQAYVKRSRPPDVNMTYIFTSLRRDHRGNYRRLASKTVRDMIRDAAARAGITKRVHPEG